MRRFNNDFSIKRVAGLSVVLVAGCLGGCDITPRPIVAGEQEVSPDPDPVAEPSDADLVIKQSTIDFGESDTSKQLDVYNSGNQDLTFALQIDCGDGPKDWLTASPMAGQCIQGQSVGIALTVDRGSLAPGLWSAEVAVTSGTIRKTVMISIAMVAVAASIDTHDFGTSSGPFELQVWNDGGGTLQYEVVDAPAWVAVDGGTGASSGPNDRKTVTLTPNRSGLAEGTHTSQLTIRPVAGQTGGTVKIGVSLTVPPPDVPTMTIQASATSGQAPLTLQFAAASSTGGPVTGLPAGSTIQWNFGDGKAPDANNPNTGNPVPHTFTVGGSFTVTLQLVLAGGQTLNFAQLPVSIAPPNNTVGPDGWTYIAPSADSRIVYVSSSQGDDANSGLSPDAPVQSLAKGKSLLRDGMPDWLLLKRGDSWNPADGSGLGQWNASGRSPSEPLLISGYGTGARPVIKGDQGIYNLNRVRSDIAAIGLDFYSSVHDPSSVDYNPADASNTGITWYGGSNILLEDCVIRWFQGGFNLHGWVGTPNGSVPLYNIVLRRNIITNNYGVNGAVAGLYAENIDGFTLDGNLFDHNGWNNTVPGGYTYDKAIRSHNVYIKENVSRVVVRNNIFANAASHGLQARSGGDVQNNLFIDNPIGMSFGFVNGSPVTPGGVQGTITGNVFVGGRDIAGSPRGWCIEISNTKVGGGTIVQNNVFTGDTQNHYAAIRLDFGSGVENPSDAAGINDLTIQNNTVYGWNSALWVSASAVPGGTGQYALNGLVVRNNGFQNLLSGCVVDHGPAMDSRYEQWQGNWYWASSNPTTWFRISSTATSWTAWQATIDPIGSNAQLAYMDPGRTVASYSGSVGGTASTDAFLSMARQQSRDHWLTAYTAVPVITCFVAGFAR